MTYGLKLSVMRIYCTSFHAGQAKIPEGAKIIFNEVHKAGQRNDGEVLYLKYLGCKAKRQRLQLSP